MRPFTSTLPFTDALARVLAAVRPIATTERVSLADADGRVAATEVVAAIDVPPFNRAAMDGYAVVAAGTAGARPDQPRTLTCVDRLFTGDVPGRPVATGECIEIATGAPMPAGADAVVMVEETARDGAIVSIRAAVQPGQNVGRQGQDVRAGTQIVDAGRWLGPAQLGALAATGLTSVDVYRRPVVSLLSTGNEVVDPGATLAPGQVYDINRTTLAAVVTRHGGVAAPLPIVGDAIDALVAALGGAARASDVVVCTGGSSVGDRDLLLDALRVCGRVHFHGIAVKPGKPTGFAEIGDTPVFALPGYPTSCLSNAYIMLIPFLRASARLPPWQPRTATLPLARRIASSSDRHQFYTVRVVNGTAEPAFKASGDITSMAGADGYIEIPAGTPQVEAGESVLVTLFG